MRFRKVPIGAVVRKDDAVVGEQWFDEMFYNGKEVHDYSPISNGRVTLEFYQGSVTVPETELVDVR